MLRTIVGGFLMGTADLVPGVSGGTIALVLGIYERLVASIKEGSSALGYLARFKWAKARGHLLNVEWAFLVPLLAGILLAVVTLAGILDHQLEERPTLLAGLFLGLVVGSVVIAWSRIGRRDSSKVVIAVLVAVALFLLLGLGEGQASAEPTVLAFVGAGALAICAMILPGISGSLILLMLGMYAPALGAVRDRDLVTIAALALGAIVGLALFSQVLNWALRNHHDPVLAALVGLMAGSTRVLWPWPDGVFSAEIGAPGEDWLGVLVVVILGGVAVYLVSRLAGERATVSEPQSS